MHPQRRKRLIWIVVLLLVLGAAVALATYALRQNINLFYTPTQLAAKEAAVGQRIQVGGLVLQGSVLRSPESLQVRFTLTDLGDTVDVTYQGILPDLFREGQGIVANGIWNGQEVDAYEVLAKHDEVYMPPHVKAAIEAAGHPASAGQEKSYGDY